MLSGKKPCKYYKFITNRLGKYEYLSDSQYTRSLLLLLHPTKCPRRNPKTTFAWNRNPYFLRRWNLKASSLVEIKDKPNPIRPLEQRLRAKQEALDLKRRQTSSSSLSRRKCKIWGNCNVDSWPKRQNVLQSVP